MLAAQVNARKARQPENDFGLRVDWGPLPLRGASLVGVNRGCSRWPWFRAIMDRISTPSLCVLAGVLSMGNGEFCFGWLKARVFVLPQY